MMLARACRSPWIRPLLLGTLMVVALPAVAHAGADESTPALVNPLATSEVVQPTPQLVEDTAAFTQPQVALATPAVTESLSTLAGQSSTAPSLLPNPCYQFDDPAAGCYYKWLPTAFCCVSPAAWCPAICY